MAALTERDIPLAERIRRKKNGFESFDPRDASENDAGRHDAEPKKRANKNCPLEMTSKRAVGRFKQVVDVKKKKHMDPRFDSMCGRLNEDLFSKSFAFVDEYKVRTVPAFAIVSGKQNSSQSRGM